MAVGRPTTGSGQPTRPETTGEDTDARQTRMDEIKRKLDQGQPVSEQEQNEYQEFDKDRK